MISDWTLNKIDIVRNNNDVNKESIFQLYYKVLNVILIKSIIYLNSR